MQLSKEFNFEKKCYHEHNEAKGYYTTSNTIFGPISMDPLNDCIYIAKK